MKEIETVITWSFCWKNVMWMDVIEQGEYGSEGGGMLWLSGHDLLCLTSVGCTPLNAWNARGVVWQHSLYRVFVMVSQVLSFSQVVFQASRRTPPVNIAGHHFGIAIGHYYETGIGLQYFSGGPTILRPAICQDNGSELTHGCWYFQVAEICFSSSFCSKLSLQLQIFFPFWFG